MFRKFTPDKHSSGKSVIKSSAQRCIVNNILGTYPALTNEQLELVLPKKEPANVVKCIDHVSLLQSSKDDVPLFFNQRDGAFYPTLRILHRLGDVMTIIYTDSGAIKPVLNGAELMCAGIRKDLLNEFPTDSPVCIMAEGKTLPYAIGITKMSSTDIAALNSGVGVEILHTLGDGLWNTDRL